MSSSTTFDTMTGRQLVQSSVPAWPEHPTAAGLTGAEFSTGPWPADRREVTFEVSHRAHRSEWLWPTIARVVHLLALPENWNGYGEQSVHGASAKRLIAILDTSGYSGPAPTVVPLADGGLQLEWHSSDASLEVEIRESGSARGFFVDATTDEEWEASTVTGVDHLRERLRRVLG